MLALLLMLSSASGGPLGYATNSVRVSTPPATTPARPSAGRPMARPALTWGMPYFWVPPPPPPQIVVIERKEPEPPKKTAWQLKPTSIENPGEVIPFDELPTALIPIEDL